MTVDEYPKKGTPEYEIQRTAFYGEIDALTAEIYKQRRPLTVNYFHEKCKTKAHASQAWGFLPRRPFFKQLFISSSELKGLGAEQARAKAKNYTSHGHHINVFYPRLEPGAPSIDPTALTKEVA